MGQLKKEEMVGEGDAEHCWVQFFPEITIKSRKK
jgi:hypothetical protein